MNKIKYTPSNWEWRFHVFLFNNKPTKEKHNNIYVENFKTNSANMCELSIDAAINPDVASIGDAI